MIYPIPSHHLLTFIIKEARKQAEKRIRIANELRIKKKIRRQTNKFKVYKLETPLDHVSKEQEKKKDHINMSYQSDISLHFN